MTNRTPVDLLGLLQAFPYPRSPPGATSDLSREIISTITAKGPIPFVDYMARCLYDPISGYYARPETPTASKEGDFITSVSVGSIFGKLLSARLCSFWKANNSPKLFPVLEPGGHDGSLAKDILTGARETDPAFADALQYAVYEPLASRQNLLEEKLKGIATVVSDPREITSPIGAIIANEVLDALPVPLYLHSGKKWHAVAVTAQDNALEWTTLPTDFSLEDSYPEGYVTEGAPDFRTFLEPLANTFDQSLLTFIDYGMDADALYHPDRTAGTLRCYRKHRSNAHPLDEPGLRDLTADVNFTAVEKAALSLGLTPHPVMNQSRFLTYCGRDWLLNSPTPQEVRQFQTLIHPGQFGSRFYFSEFTKGPVQRAFPA